MRAADVTTIKNVLLPSEHGASVMAGESLVAGLLIAASAKTFLLALGFVFLFLMTQPLKIAIKDMRQNVLVHRTKVALGAAVACFLLAGICLTETYALRGGAFLLMILTAVPLVLLHFWSVVSDGKKELVAELLGALSLGAIAAAIIVTAGYSYIQAFVLWGILAVRCGTSVIYVRYRLNQSRGKEQNPVQLVFVHVIGVGLLGIVVISYFAKPIILIGGLLLVLRLFFVYKNFLITPQKLGIQEIIIGAMFVFFVSKAL